MIRIERTDPLPEVLRTKGKAKRRAHSSSYTRYRADYDSGARPFPFESNIYAHREVKERLLAMQHGKCAFCESQVTHIAYGDVEHFRPKAAVQQRAADPLTWPGYYWLAYEWSNLMFSCQFCNQRNKGNLFPLADPGARARSHQDDIGRELPLFINPTTGDPETLLGFRAEIIYGLDSLGRGEATRDALDLNRPALMERRRDRFETYKALFELIIVAESRPTDIELGSKAAAAREILEQAVATGAEYAGMIRAALKNGFRIPG